jgi:NADPH-dependent ferric siderophore reductase
MSSTKTSETVPTRAQGRLTQALVRLFMKHTTVVSSEPLAPGFHLLTLTSPQFKGFAWSAGQKVQISMGSAFASRTYTPIEWNATEGRTRIVAYAHGDGPGSVWTRNARPGDTCEVFGPRASLDVTGVDGPAIVFGDETSFGLATTIARQPRLEPIQYLLEVNAADTARPVLRRLGINPAAVFTRTPGDEHLRDIERQFAEAASSGATFVLTGKASSIQRLRQYLKTLKVPSARVMTKAYWAPGKVGLD